MVMVIEDIDAFAAEFSSGRPEASFAIQTCSFCLLTTFFTEGSRRLPCSFKQCSVHYRVLCLRFCSHSV